MSSPELSVVCRNCGSEVSPYVTECPYCGQRLRKRAPKLQRDGDEIKVREGRREKRLRKDAERRTRAEARMRGEGGGRFEDLATRPVATAVFLAVPAIVFIVQAASNLTVTELGAIVGDPGSEYWRYVTAPFFFDDAGYLFACGVAIAIFMPPLERRIGSVATFILALACGALGMLAAVGIDAALGDDFPVAAGANGIALGLLAAYVVVREPERRADPEESYDPIAVAVAAVVLLALPLVDDFADPWAGVAGAVVGGLCGLTASLGEQARTPGVSKFTAVDERLHRYIVEHGARQDEVLRRVQAETAAMGDISRMQIAPDQGAFMTLLTRAIGAREALEVGTFTGYSAICIARGLEPGGRLLCCELSEEFAEIAARNLEDAGVADRVEIRVGPAAETLAALPEREVFDLTFIDADKAGYPVYFEEALKRTRQGGLILLDNVLAGGAIAVPEDEVPEERSATAAALGKVNDALAEDDRIDLAMLGIADGLTIARKR